MVILGGSLLSRYDPITALRRKGGKKSVFSDGKQKSKAAKFGGFLTPTVSFW